MSEDEAENPDVDLAELHQGVMDGEMLEQYFKDLELTKVFDVLLKGAPEEHAKEGTFSLDEGRELFVSKVVRGLQIRYLYDDDEWWDTLMHAPGGVRLVRVRHDWSEFE